MDPEKYVDRKIALVSAAFGKLTDNIFSNGCISMRIKTIHYRNIILPVAVVQTHGLYDPTRYMTFEFSICVACGLGVVLHELTEAKHPDDVRHHQT